MLFQLGSDLHTELRPDVLGALPSWRDPEADLLVLAGDVLNLKREESLRKLLLRCGAWKRVLYVTGNHEYWGTEPRKAHELLNRVADDRREGEPELTAVTEPRVVEIGGHRFFCGTMWYDWEACRRVPGGNPGNCSWTAPNGERRYFADHTYIKHHTPWVYDANRRFDHLLGDLREGDVVVSHHLPSHQSTPEEFRHEADNCYYVDDHEYLILNRQPALWLHGHTHQPCDYMVGQTRVVANPLGYPRERALKGYRPLAIEV